MAVNLLAINLRDSLSPLHLFTVQFHRVGKHKSVKVKKINKAFKQMFDINVKVKVKVSEKIKHIHI